MICGYFCPKKIVLIIVLGILWELYECVIEYIQQTNVKHFICKNLIKCHKNNNLLYKHYWEHYLGIKDHNILLTFCSGGLVGGILDIIADILGVYFGAYILTKYFKFDIALILNKYLN